ncbi:MAG: WecB/TagA/CpsF family glycosyltransferase [Planctomycetota bacterium]|nr:WecB/TagA/CpsF family glycosyltransferase [Planctomycetota bacterium]
MTIVNNLKPEQAIGIEDGEPSSVRESQGQSELPLVTLRGMPVHALTETQCVQFIMDELQVERGGWVITPNLDHARRWTREEEFKEFYREATLVTPDGMPLVWASRLQGTPLPERVAGSNLIDSISRSAATQGRSIFLLGGQEGTAERAGEELTRRYPSLQLAGMHYPPFGFENDREQSEAIIKAITDAKPDIVFVAVGSPKQERLISQLRPLLPATWWLGVGISFSFLADHVKRAPRWMQRTGLEWAHRLAQEPRRLGRRYLVEGLPFAAGLLMASAWSGVRTRWHGPTPGRGG